VARRLTLAVIQRHRLDAQKARTDMRDWAKARRERTRHLIELGGLVQKAGLVELLDDDRATLLGAFLHLADQLRGAEDAGDDPHHIITRWRRRGLRAFDADRNVTARTEQSDPQADRTAPS
jgi:Conjugal transfer protein TraD